VNIREVKEEVERRVILRFRWFAPDQACQGSSGLFMELWLAVATDHQEGLCVCVKWEAKHARPSKIEALDEALEAFRTALARMTLFNGILTYACRLPKLQPNHSPQAGGSSTQSPLG
jgi:hypothetical protein